MPYINQKGRNDKPFSKKTIIVILAVLVVAFAVAIFLQSNRDRKLENSKEIKAKITEIYQPHGAAVEFNVNGKMINTQLLNGNYTMLNVGDSITVKYSVEDPELIELVDKGK